MTYQAHLKLLESLNILFLKEAIKQIIDKTKKKKTALGIHVLQTSIKEVKAQLKKVLNLFLMVLMLFY